MPFVWLFILLIKLLFFVSESVSELENKLRIVKEWMDVNLMEINPSKCGVMDISPNLEEPFVIKYNGEVIPSVERYTYLGVEFNSKLDLDVMAEFRVGKGVAKVNALRPTLGNSGIPLEYKRMLVNSIVIPTVTYGTEVFGMSEKRMQALKKVVDSSITAILNCRGYCRQRAYEELDLKAVAVKAAVSRARAYEKWKTSRSLIRDLIATSVSFKSKNYTWSKATRVWLKCHKLESNGQIRREVLYEYSKRLSKRDKSEISKFAKITSIGSGKLIRKLELNSCEGIGYLALTKIRTGSYPFVNRLVVSGRLSHNCINKCIFCGENTRENAEHVLLKCSAWNQERSEILQVEIKDLPEEVASRKINKILKSFLGG